MNPFLMTLALLSFSSSLVFINDASAPAQAGTVQVSQEDSRVEELIQAVHVSAFDKLKVLLEQGVDVNSLDHTNRTALMNAAEMSNLPMIKALIKAGATINLKNKYGNTSLMSAALYGGSETVKYLLNEGAEIDAQNKKLQTALMFAAMRGEEEITKLLLKKGASINHEDGDRFTALTYALRAENDVVAQLLVAAGASDPQPNLKDVPVDSSPGFDRKAKLLNFPQPKYTEEARRNRVEGSVRVRIIVGADGTVKDAKAVTTLPDGLTEMAISAAMNLKFEPATKDGKPVNYSTVVEVNFNLRR